MRGEYICINISTSFLLVQKTEKQKIIQMDIRYKCNKSNYNGDDDEDDEDDEDDTRLKEKCCRNFEKWK